MENKFEYEILMQKFKIACLIKVHVFMWRTGLGSGTELDCDRLKEGGMLNFFKYFKQGQRSACI